MTPVAARRRQDVGRMDSRGRVGSVCGFSLPGDGRHKWRPYVWFGGDGWLAAGGGCCGAAAGMLGSPAVSPCRVILVSACCRGAIYDARCRPQAARCRPHGQSRVLGEPPRACWVRLRFRPAGLSWCRRVVGAPFMTPAAARRRQDVGRTDSRGCWASRRGHVGFACGFALPGYLGVGVL